MSANETLKERIWKEIDEMNVNYGKFEQVKKIELCEAAWTIETGELTPSLKLKRKFILSKYEQLMTKIYAS